jgi:anti-sigma factor RsiW
MNISRDVVDDLLPLYLAGEASAGTRALVEEYLRANPEFAAAIREQADPSVALLAEAAPPPPPDHEKATFERSRRFNGYRHQLLGFTIAFALMPFAFVFSEKGIRWLMLRDNPKQAALFLAAAAGCWIGYFLAGRRLRAS